MSSLTKTTLAGAGILLIGILVGIAGAQALQAPADVRYINSGLFSVPSGETAFFRVALEDRRSGPASRVVLFLFDEQGATVATQDLILSPGRSATLTTAGPGVYRAHAQIYHPIGDVGPRRTAMGTVEIGRGDLTTGPRRPVCVVEESHSIPRPQ